MDIKLPDGLSELIGNRNFKRDDIGLSDSNVMCSDDMVLKIERENPESDNEHQMMKWLWGKLPVPEVFLSVKENGFNYLLMSRLRGRMSCSEEYLQNPRELVRLLAEGLRLLWSLDVAGCPNDGVTDRKLELAQMRIRKGLCVTDDAEPGTFGENGFSSPEELLRWLREHKPEEDLVFSHGDYCLPNIFLLDGGISGFIDLGRSGTADKYQDIALCYRSLLHNFEGRYDGKTYAGLPPEALFQELDIRPDMDKINYYILLDELF